MPLGRSISRPVPAGGKDICWTELVWASLSRRPVSAGERASSGPSSSGPSSSGARRALGHRHHKGFHLLHLFFQVLRFLTFLPGGLVLPLRWSPPVFGPGSPTEYGIYGLHRVRLRTRISPPRAAPAVCDHPGLLPNWYTLYYAVQAPSLIRLS